MSGKPSERTLPPCRLMIDQMVSHWMSRKLLSVKNAPFPRTSLRRKSKMP